MSSVDYKRVDYKVSTTINAEPLAEGLHLNGPVADFDWGAATVVVKVPVYSTATTEAAEVEVPLGVLARLLHRAHATHVTPAFLGQEEDPDA